MIPFSSAGRHLYLLGAASIVLLRGAWMLWIDDDRLLTMVPDDAFYYLELARNFVPCGGWTFDCGLTKTTGFHPLHAWLNIAPSVLGWRWVVGVNLLAGVLASVAALALLGAVLARQSGGAAPLAVLLVGSSVTFLVASTSVMEWYLVVLFSALLVWFVVAGRRALLAGAVGALASLARIDSGGLPAFLLFATVLDVLLRRRRGAALDDAAARLRVAASGLAGAVAGVLLVIAHNQLLIGQAISGSGRIKLYWGTLGPPAPTLFMLTDSIGLAAVRMEVWRIAVFSLVVGACVLLAWLGRPAAAAAAAPAPDRSFHRVLVPSMALTVAFYLLLYRRIPSVQVWHSASLVVPATLVLGFVCRALGSSRASHGLLAATAVVLALHNLHHSLQPVWPWQPAMRTAGQNLFWSGIEAPVGAWNAGILSYFHSGRVVNLDGLMNDEIEPYIRAGTVVDYLREKEIRFVAEFEAVVNSARWRELGGAGLLEVAKPVATLAPPIVPSAHPGTLRGSPLNLYRVEW